MKKYDLYITPAAWAEIKKLPGHVRQRARKVIRLFEENPRPPKSKILTVADLPYEVRRHRIDRWRIIYAVTEADHIVDVLAVRKRPPYDYGDLASLLEEYRPSE